MAESKKDTTPTPSTTAKSPSTQPIDWRNVHLWQIQPIRDGLVVAGIIGLIYLGKVLSIVTIPMLLALLLAYLFEPLIRRVTVTKHVSRQGAALGIIVIASAVVFVPLTIGAVVGVVQGASVAGNIAEDAADLLKAVDTHTSEAERQAAYKRLDGGFWRWSTDSITKLRREVNDYRRHRGLPPLKRKSAADAATAGESEPTPAGEESAAPATPPADLPQPDDPKDAAQPTDTGSPDTASADSSQPAAESDPASAAAPTIQHAPVELPAWKEQLYNAISGSLEWIQLNSRQLAQNLGKQVIGGGASLIGSALGILQSIGFLLFSAFLTAFFFFFFSTSWGRVLEFWESLIPERRKNRVIDLLQKMDRVIAGFIRGRLTICLMLSVYMTIAYLLIGVPSALLLGPIVGLMFIVPFAHVLGVPIAMILMSLQPSAIEWQNAWWWIVFAPIGVYMGAQILDDYILSPMIQGKNTNMDTPTILFASLAGGALAGVYGLLIAIPAAACIKILFVEVFMPRFREWARGKKPDFLPIEN
ncbi:MAG: AI-2E family transporter [Phycisphaerales bacterium]|nr:AI-2E family transporter [Phycisphaerales bacterium]